MKKRIFLSHFYIAALTIYPILALQQANIDYVNMSGVIRSLGFALLFAGVGFFLLRIIYKDSHKSGILTAIGSLLFFSYGHIYILAIESPIGQLRHRMLIVLYLLILSLAAFFLHKQRSVDGLVRFLNITSVVAIGLILVQLIVYEIKVQRSAQLASQNRAQEVISNGENVLPDIYLILLDAYTRSDVLLKVYEYENADFISSLEEMGFYIANCSQSNYPGTNLSITSLMNMDYFYNLFNEVQTLPPLKRSTVSETLRALGYSTIAFENRVIGHFDLKEDIHLSRNATVLENVDIGGGINEFESMLIETSLLRIFVDMPQLIPGIFAGDIKEAEFYDHYMQTIYILEELKNLPDMPGPKFVMAHIMTPHDPYIFSPDGSYQPSGGKGPIVGYRNNVSFIDNFLPEALHTIINNSEIPPIIIVQGDHGPSGEEVSPENRISILNAYYIEDEYKDILYPSVTPVNSFRIIFNTYFDTHYPLLPDRSHYIWNLDQMLDQENEMINNCTP
jgi:hypothetical protein